MWIAFLPHSLHRRTNIPISTQFSLLKTNPSYRSRSGISIIRCHCCAWLPIANSLRITGQLVIKHIACHQHQSTHCLPHPYVYNSDTLSTHSQIQKRGFHLLRTAGDDISVRKEENLLSRLTSPVFVQRVPVRYPGYERRDVELF